MSRREGCVTYLEGSNEYLVSCYIVVAVYTERTVKTMMIDAEYELAEVWRNPVYYKEHHTVKLKERDVYTSFLPVILKKEISDNKLLKEKIKNFIQFATAELDNNEVLVRFEIIPDDSNQDKALENFLQKERVAKIEKRCVYG